MSKSNCLTVFLVVFMMALPFLSNGQQRPSLTKTAEAVDSLEIESATLRDRIMAVELKLQEQRADTAKVAPAQPAIPLKIPTNSMEVLAATTVIMSYLGFLFTGAISKKLPKWLTKFTLSLIVAGALSGVAFAFGKGQYSVAEMMLVFGSILGFSNGAHQTSKTKAEPSQVAAG